MEIAIIGPGRIGGNIARRFARAGHHITLSFSRDQAKLDGLAADIGGTAGTPSEAVAGAEAVVISVPWSAIPDALEQVGSLADKIVIDTTNQFGSGPMPAEGQTAAAFNAARMPGARYTKSFNTLTSAFQEQTADRPADARVVQWICGDDAGAKQEVAELLASFGWAADSIVDLGGIDAARGTEMYLALWIRLMGTQGTPQFNIAVVR